MKPQVGFTLVEMAVVVFLIGLIATLGITALNTQLANAAISATQSKEATLRDALMNYLRLHNRLPCPATDNTGKESRAGGTPSNCTGKFGIIPYFELGLPQSVGLDGWNNFFSYAVSPQWTLTYGSANTTYTTTTAANGFNAGDVGLLSVNNRIPATNATPTSISTTAVAVIVSHGINGLGAFTSKGTQNASPAAGTDELQNTPTSTTWPLPTTAFYQRDYTDTNVPTYGAFDDIVVWLSANDLLTPLMKDGALPSAQAQWASQLAQINSALAFSMFTTPFSNCPAPANQAAFNAILASNNIPLADPWGGALTYTQVLTRMRPWGGVSPFGAVNPYTIATTAPNPGAQIPTNATLYTTYQTAISNNCN